MATETPSGKFALPRFLSVVPHVDWKGFTQKIDHKSFVLSFFPSLAVFLSLAFGLPMLLHQSTDPSKVDAKSTAQAREVIANNSPLSERAQIAADANDAVDVKLPPAPIDALEEAYKQGYLPRTSDDGRKPWFLYSRPFDKADSRPKIVAVVAGLGISRFVSEWAITQLPPQVTLAFPSSAEAVGAWLGRARESGHETMLSLPMEPLDYPASDPGPGAILVKNNRTTNLERLKEQLSKGRGYVGVTTVDGSRITSSPQYIKPLLDEFKTRGLMFLDAKLTERSAAYELARNANMPAAETNFSLTADMSPEAVEATFNMAEQYAIKNRTAVVLIYPAPSLLKHLKEWAATLKGKGFALAPVTSLASE